MVFYGTFSDAFPTADAVHFTPRKQHTRYIYFPVALSLRGTLKGAPYFTVLSPVPFHCRRGLLHENIPFPVVPLSKGHAH